MKKNGLFIAIVMMAVMTPAFATTYYWTNGNADNDFSSLANWNTKADGSGSVATDFSGDTLNINKSGTDMSLLCSDLSTDPKSVVVGSADDTTGELLVSGGINKLGAGCSLRVALKGATGIFTMAGGQLSVLDGYTTFADGSTSLLGSTATANISGGTLNADRITIAQYAGDTGTLNMTGGTINVFLGDLTPTATGGSIRSGAGNATVNISDNAVLNTLKLGLSDGLLLHMNGGTINVLGVTDADIPSGVDYTALDRNTFDFTEESIALGEMLGKIEFNAGQFIVTGDYESLLDSAIGSGNIYTSVAGMSVDAQYAEGFTTLQLIPEPCTLLLLGLGGLVLRRKVSL